MTTAKSVALMLFVLLLSFILAPSLEAYFTPAPVVVKCYEDEPCWNCETMGNKICGPNYERNTSDDD